MKFWQILVALAVATLWFVIVVVAPCLDNFGNCPL